MILSIPKYLARSTPFMENESFGSETSKSWRTVSRKASTASEKSLDPIVLTQSNMLTQFVRYWPVIHIFHKNRLSTFWEFIRVQLYVFYKKISRSGKSVSKGFFICWTMIKSWKGFNSQWSSWNSSSQSRNVCLLLYIQGTKRGFITISAILNVGWCRGCKANSYLIIYRSKKGDDLDLFLAFWNRERSSVPIKRNIRLWVLCQKVLADFDKERARNRPRKRSRDTFLHLGNATLYRAPRDFDPLGITRLLHSSCSPDLAPCDFWLFRTLKRKLEGSTFGDPVEVLTAVSTILSTIPLNVFIFVFDEWKCRLREYIDKRGEYL
jgi:hypothetical protein